MQILHGYNIDEKQWKAGNGGQYNVATKDGKEYCIKRLTSPRYPVSDNFKGEFKQKKIDLCNEWLRCHQLFLLKDSLHIRITVLYILYCRNNIMSWQNYQRVRKL